MIIIECYLGLTLAGIILAGIAKLLEKEES